MQKENSNSNGGSTMQRISSPSTFLEQAHKYSDSSIYSTIYPPSPSLLSQPSFDYSTDEDIATATGISYSPPLPELISKSTPPQFVIDQLQDLIGRDNWMLSYLYETVKQAETLRQENINLRMANINLSNLNNRLSSMLQSSPLQNASVSASEFAALISPSSSSGKALANDFMWMSIGEKPPASESHAWNEVGDDHESPTSVIESDRAERLGVGVDRVTLPKSISVRSNGYLKTVQAGGSTAPRVKAPNRIKKHNNSQKVYVRGGKKEEQYPLELDVYDQGMFKTELCNKWQESGSCPYGDHCQFAHGIEELRPVLRHPRYKTEVCRMVLNGDPCPYGHRCHFRHSLTDQEKLIAAIKSRAFNFKALNQ